MKMDFFAGFKLLMAGSVFFPGMLVAFAQSGSPAPTYAYIGAPALSLSNLTLGGGILFEVRFDAATFAGDLIARVVAADGSFKPDEFDAEGNLTAFNGLWRAKTTVTAQSKRTGGSAIDDRIIFTAGDDGTGTLEGRRFWWNNAADDAFTDVMKAVINGDTAVEADSDPVTDWVRGYDTSEGSDDADLRQRSTVLGNLVHGSPGYLGPPSQLFTESSYVEFRLSHRGRDPLVLVGGGDAMLHGFRAGDGVEVFAYIPREMLGAVRGLTSKSHAERFLVDGSPTTGDAWGAFPMCGDGDCWRTILVSGLGVGGRTIFALDLTDPAGDIGDVDREYNAARKLFLWEFTDPDLGLTTSEPLIARLKDGTWVAIFGSGQDAGKAALFVVDLASGVLIEKIEATATGAGNGLSSPVGWDPDFDGDIDVVYAGDLEGNVWKFDLTNATADGGVAIAYSGNPLLGVTGPAWSGPLPITTRPLVSANPGGGVMVYFGTGMHGQEPGDSNGMFGVADKGVSLGSDPVLVVHSVEAALYDAGDPGAIPGKYRIIAASTEPDDPVGWKLQLPPGERILTNPILNNARVSFTSSGPVVSNFRQNWFNGIDFVTGGPPATPFLDLNGDGAFDDDDLFPDIKTDGNMTADDDVPATGRFLGPGVVSAPTPANIANGKDTVYITHGLEVVESGQNLRDPGVPGGQFDEDNFDWSPDQFDLCAEQIIDDKTGQSAGSICTTANSCWSRKCHTDRYDDVWDVDGVNMLFGGGILTSPPDVDSASGILSDKHRGLLQAITVEDSGTAGTGLRGYNATVNDEIFIWIRNPNSVDTQALVNQRIQAGVEDPQAGPAPPATLYFNCDRDGDGVGDKRIVIDAPGFNLLAGPSRTCVIADITELRVRHNNTNALRATETKCVTDHFTDAPLDSLGNQTLAHPNTSYRNGAFTVQAITTGGRKNPGESTVYGSSGLGPGIVIWENSNYEHVSGAGNSGGCSAFNEEFRKDNGPADLGGSGTTGPGETPGGGNTITNDQARGSQLTENVDVTQSELADGRVFWREVLE